MNQQDIKVGMRVRARMCKHYQYCLPQKEECPQECGVIGTVETVEDGWNGKFCYVLLETESMSCQWWDIEELEPAEDTP